MKLPSPKEESAQYQGTFAAPAFRLFSGDSAVAFQENLFSTLSRYGARIENLKLETGNAPSITYDLSLSLNCVVRIALDKLDVSFFSLGILGDERARELTLGCLEAISSTGDRVTLARHSITLSYQFELGDDEYKRVLGHYVKIPKGLPADADPGVVFYIRPSELFSYGASVILDRLTPGILNLRIVMVLDAATFSPQQLSNELEKYVQAFIKQIDLEIE
jgi:hypothetical protein